jgi:5-methylcytosine-specific restriction enzyme A
MAKPQSRWHALYNTKRWQRRRLLHLQEQPCCVMCEAAGKVTPGTHVDHVTPHHGDEELFWGGALQSLCPPCHMSRKTQLEQHGYMRDVGVDGWPLDVNHPANQPAGWGGAYPIPLSHRHKA